MRSSPDREPIGPRWTDLAAARFGEAAGEGSVEEQQTPYRRALNDFRREGRVMLPAHVR